MLLLIFNKCLTDIYERWSTVLRVSSLALNTLQLSTGDIYVHKRHKMITSAQKVEPKKNPMKIQQKERFSATEGSRGRPEGRWHLCRVLQDEEDFGGQSRRWKAMQGDSEQNNQDSEQSDHERDWHGEGEAGCLFETA